MASRIERDPELKAKIEQALALSAPRDLKHYWDRAVRFLCFWKRHDTPPQYVPEQWDRAVRLAEEDHPRTMELRRRFS